MVSYSSQRQTVFHDSKITEIRIFNVCKQGLQELSCATSYVLFAIRERHMEVAFLMVALDAQSLRLGRQQTWSEESLLLTHSSCSQGPLRMEGANGLLWDFVLRPLSLPMRTPFT